MTVELLERPSEAPAVEMPAVMGAVLFGAYLARLARENRIGAAR